MCECREEIEAYVNEGVVTHTGLAFSRDTDKKVYIQHKMNEDAQLLATMMEKGSTSPSPLPL
jgi:sulfite reductase (NADPH) flavoprotein alpha-component